MITFTKTLFVNQSVETAFAYCTDNENFDRWMPGIIMSKLTSDDEFGIGTTFNQTMKIGKKIEQVSGRVVASETNRKWSYVGHSEKFWFRRTWTFELLSKGTKIHYTEEITQKSFGAVYIEPVLRYMTNKANDESLNALKRDLESTGRYLPALTH